jgi:hypothetical protein
VPEDSFQVTLAHAVETQLEFDEVLDSLFQPLVSLGPLEVTAEEQKALFV